MNEILSNIMTRRSVRKYLDKQIPEDVMSDILTAGLSAPSGMNTQNWLFTVVSDSDKLEKLKNAMATALSRPDYQRFYGAPTLVIITVPADYRLGQADTACALENMFLAAHSMGVGSVWINQLKDCCNYPDVRDILASFGIPDNHVAYGSGAFGYADGEVNPNRENIGKVNFVK